ncbi:hypothetical protein [Reichenbachiella sp. 5M10]|uniref:hypothetical protein n=1 Tax=Reichenbachiella sp. 5M10 TaxID=1889772 RepID=UPI0013043A0B|nr:hypothetical protein [Reichenbachiella sp. 5M10]
MKLIKALFVGFALLSFVSACSQEEDLVQPDLDLQNESMTVGERDYGTTPPTAP